MTLTSMASLAAVQDEGGRARESGVVAVAREQPPADLQLAPTVMTIHRTILSEWCGHMMSHGR
jgi:hypothetical protein